MLGNLAICEHFGHLPTMVKATFNFATHYCTTMDKFRLFQQLVIILYIFIIL